MANTSHRTYAIIELDDPKTHRAVGCYVPLLAATFATVDEAKHAIDRRISEVLEELMRHPLMKHASAEKKKTGSRSATPKRKDK